MEIMAEKEGTIRDLGIEIPEHVMESFYHDAMVMFGDSLKKKEPEPRPIRPKCFIDNWERSTNTFDFSRELFPDLVFKGDAVEIRKGSKTEHMFRALDLECRYRPLDDFGRKDKDVFGVQGSETVGAHIRNMLSRVNQIFKDGRANSLLNVNFMKVLTVYHEIGEVLVGDESFDDQDKNKGRDFKRIHTDGKLTREVNAVFHPMTLIMDKDGDTPSWPAIIMANLIGLYDTFHKLTSKVPFAKEIIVTRIIDTFEGNMTWLALHDRWMEKSKNRELWNSDPKFAAEQVEKIALRFRSYLSMLKEVGADDELINFCMTDLFLPQILEYEKRGIYIRPMFEEKRS